MLEQVSLQILQINDKNIRYTIGVLVQANYGLRDHLTIAGVPVGEELKSELLPKIQLLEKKAENQVESGSVIVIDMFTSPL